MAAMSQHDRPLTAVIGFFAAFHEPASHEAIDQPAGRRRGACQRFGKLADRGGAAIREDVQGGELGEPESQVRELGRETDDQLAPQGTAHRDPLGNLADVRDARAGRQNGCAEISLEPTGDRTYGRCAGSPSSWKCVGHVRGS